MRMRIVLRGIRGRCCVDSRRWLPVCVCVCAVNMARFLDREAVIDAVIDAVSEDLGSNTDSHSSASSSSESEESKNDRFSKRRFVGGSKKRRLTYSENGESDKGKQQRRKSLLHVTETSKSRDRGNRKVLREIQKSNKLLTLVERVNKTEKRLKVVLSNRSLGSSSSEVDSTPSRTPRRSHTKHVPHVVRVRVCMSVSTH